MAILLALALILRLYGVNWDQWMQFHPDERMIMMVADKIKFFDNLNPDFFNYGSLPIYILRAIGLNAGYHELLKIGRYLSIFFDLVTVVFIYKIAKRIFTNERVALSAGFLYSVAFFPIQNSHFFVVDVFLTTLTAIFIYRLIIYLKKPSLKGTLIAGIVFAAMTATKFTAIIFAPIAAGVILWKNRKDLKKTVVYLIAFAIASSAAFCLFMPYAVIDYGKFLSDISGQLRMNSNPYTFPYTLQFVGTLPYLYHLGNIFLWGLGPLISILALTGIINLGKYARNVYFLLMAFVVVYYFAIIGRSAVKFMRYMLPVYPFLTIVAGYGLTKVKHLNRYLAAVLIGLVIMWTLAFINIYSRPNTRIAASEWIEKNIPSGSTLAVEYWDDRLPSSGSENYSFESLPIYDQPDTVEKWDKIDSQLDRSDYLVIASNRLYGPLMRLTDCAKYRVCYRKSAEYYDKLFSGRYGFRQVAEFSSYPGFTIGKLFVGINDQSADESFTVYDHPKIMIFKKSK